MDDLEQRLVALGRQLDFPPTPALAAALRPRVAARPRRRPFPRWRAASAIAIAAVVIVLGDPDIRTAFAHWLGIRGVVITPVQSLPPTASPHPASSPSGLGASLNLGQPTTLAVARSQAGFSIAVPSSMPTPDAIYTRTDLGKVVSLVYGPRLGLPASQHTGVGLLITEFRGSVDPALFQKFVGPDSTATPVTVGGGSGFWISGAPHELGYQLPDGTGQIDDLRLAGPTLVFERGDVTVRIEGTLTEDQALALAASLG
jgi:hypothetical protein